MQPLRYIAAALVFLLAFAAAPLVSSALTDPGEAMADYQLPDAVENQKHSLLELAKGKTALILYWSLTCSHCREEIPVLLETIADLPPDKFVLLAISADPEEMADAVAGYARAQNLPEPYLMDVGENGSMPFGEGMNIVMTPAVFLLDKEGRLIFSHETRADMNTLKEAILASFD